jgi:hypothetical protein
MHGFTIETIRAKIHMPAKVVSASELQLAWQWRGILGWSMA